MSIGRSVQYTTREQVLSAYETFDIPSWSIRHGNQLLWKYAGDDLAAGGELLDRVLKDIEDVKSIGIYTLCLYEKQPEEIRLKTEYDMSFNFRFQVESENFVSGGKPSAILEELREMRREMNELRARIDDDDEDDPPPSPLGTVGELLKNPEFMALLGQVLGNKTPVSPAQLSGIDDEETKIARAIPILKKHDPNLGSHLLKLAELAEKNSVKFKTMISILDSM